MARTWMGQWQESVGGKRNAIRSPLWLLRTLCGPRQSSGVLVLLTRRAGHNCPLRSSIRGPGDGHADVEECHWFWIDLCLILAC